ncbi:MAG: RagB/SusD family nutrient uptake outer membrane protein [Duncaniella sp.]|nr:RagB/SusD family nutrient uptake outer membrane protein [Duncaniella sp.]
MKLRNIFIAGMSAVALAGCSDYLEVDAPSKNLPTDVFSDARAMERARNGVYATMLSSNLFGDKLINTFVRNSDVDFVSNSSQYTQSNKYCRFDCDPDGGDLKSTWSDLYHGIEVCNLFIEGAEGSPEYDPENPDPDILQMIGEAKAVRAIYYHELIWLFGDVPFSFNSSQTSETMVYPVTDRIVILDKCIEDLKSVADDMKDPSAMSEGIERISRQAAYGIIARLALTAGGWYLAPDGDTYGKMVRVDNYRDYYQRAYDYALKVENSGIHALNKEYYKVFVDECNNIVTNNDDPMFEIPFGKESTGNIGYIHGPKMDQYEGITPHPYGKASSGARVSAFYRFMFDEDDQRRDFVNQLFRYTADGTEYSVRMENSYTIQNGKWSKLWVNGGLGNATEGNTGINYPYLRYADVLLMLAEADNELNNGPTQVGIDAVKAVRTRAFGAGSLKVEAFPQGSKEEFLKTVLDERKFEFAGENMRWRDLVRNNMYKEEIYWTFYRYYAMATGTDLSIVSERDLGDDEAYDNIPTYIYNVRNYPNRYKTVHSNAEFAEFDGQAILSERQFPNREMNICWALNPYKVLDPKVFNKYKAEYNDIPTSEWQSELFFEWVDGEGELKNEIRYSLLGYMYVTETGVLQIVRNGVAQPAPAVSLDIDPSTLPEVRYILPYPRSEIARAQGKYVNKYGYNN